MLEGSCRSHTDCCRAAADSLRFHQHVRRVGGGSGQGDRSEDDREEEEEEASGPEPRVAWHRRSPVVAFRVVPEPQKRSPPGFSVGDAGGVNCKYLRSAARLQPQ